MATPSRHEVEHLHRLMMQASVEAAQLDRRLQEEQKHDGLSRHLQVWRQAATALHSAVGRARGELQAGGTPRTQVDAILGLFDDVLQRGHKFDLGDDLDACVTSWKMSGLHLAQVSGKSRDPLVKLLSQWQSRIDEATRGLAAAQASGGMAPEAWRKVRSLQDAREQARAKYERLRFKYFEAERHHQTETGKLAVQAAPGAPARAARVIVPPWAQGGKRGPVLVELPDHPGRGPSMHAGGLAGRAPHGKGLHSLPHTGATVPHIGMPAVHVPARPPHPAAHPALPAHPAAHPAHRASTLAPPAVAAAPAAHPAHPAAASHPSSPSRPAAPQPAQRQQPAPSHPLAAPRPAGGLQPHHTSTLRGAQRPAKQGALSAARSHGPLRITLEKVDRPAGFPTGTDGIGRGTQTAHLSFRADNFDGDLSISGTTAIALGCNTTLAVAPSLHLFSSSPGQPVRGRLSLGLTSSGGRLGLVSPRNALENARKAATDAAARVAEKIGPIGRQLQKAIGDLLAEAAVKVFTLAQAHAVPNRLPSQGPRGGARHLPVEHHVARFNHALGGMLHEARSVKGAGANRNHLHHILDREHAHGGGVAGRLEATLSHLATATHRTLTDSHAGELRNHLARMGSILARLRGQGGDQLLEGAHEIGHILSQMGSIASSKGGAHHVAHFRRLIDERRGQLARIAGEARKGQGAHAHQGHGQPLLHMPSAQVLGEKALERLRKQHPGLDQLLRNASTSQLSQELFRVERGALQALGGKVHGPHPRRGHPGLGGASLGGGMGAALGGGHLGGFSGGNRGGSLGHAPAQGGLHQLHAHHAHALHRELKRQTSHARHQAVTRALTEMGKAPKGSPLHDLALKTEERRKLIAGRQAPLRHGPPPAAITAAAFQEAFRSHAKGHGHAGHFARGGVLHSLLDATQRSHGLPVASMASHFLASRGQSRIFNAVQTFHGLVKDGHKPRFAFWSHLKESVSNTFQRATSAVSSTVSRVQQVAQRYVAPVAAGISSFANRTVSAARQTVSDVVHRGVGFAQHVGHQAVRIAQRTGQRLAPFVQRATDRIHNLGQRINDGAHGLAHAAQGAWDTAGERAHGAADWVKQHGKAAFGRYQDLRGRLWSGVQNKAHWLGDKASGLGQAALQGVKNYGAAQWSAMRSVGNATGNALSWIGNKVGGAVEAAGNGARAAAGWVGTQAQRTLEGVKKTGVVGAVSGLVRRGLSTASHLASAAWRMSPIGRAVSKGWSLAKNPLTSIWNSTRNVAGQAWTGMKKGYKAAAGFLQSPAGQLLVTGLSLAATFIPGGVVVKALIGGGIGLISAISEGKDLKGIVTGTLGGALQGAVPFLKIGPLAKLGVAGVTSALGSVASGGSWKDAVKAGAGGMLDAFDPGALKQLKGLRMAGKLISGKNLSKAEQLAMGASKASGPLQALEKAMANPRARKLVTGLEKTGGKLIRGSVYVSRKAAQAQNVLDKALSLGDKADGALKQIHDNAPGVANFFGDNAVGHFISGAGDLAGKSEAKLSHALEWGHARSDQLSTYRGYLDKGLGYVNPRGHSRVFERQMAGRAARGGNLGPRARQKLDQHRLAHPELHLARATGQRVRGEGQAPARGRAPHPNGPGGHESGPVGGHWKRAPGHRPPRPDGWRQPEHGPSHPVHGEHPGRGPGGRAASPRGAAVHGHAGRSAHPRTALERALQRGQQLKKQGLQVAAGVHHNLGNIHSVLARGLEHADKIQRGLEQATSLARQGAGYLGEDTELGQYLLHMADRAEQAHGYIEQGIGFAHDFNHSLGQVNHAIGHLPGERQAERARYGKKGHGDHASPLHHAVHLDGKPAPRGHAGHPAHGPHAPGPGGAPHPLHPAHPDVRKPASETGPAHDARMKRAYEAIGNVSRRVNAFEAKFGKIAANIRTLLHGGKAQAASLEMQALGGECEEIQRSIQVATTLAHGHPGYEKEIRFYLEWHAKARAKVHGMIADTRGLGDGTAISGFGVDERRHPDIFQNTRDIYAVQAKVNAFGEALGDHEAHAHVEKVLADAKSAKAHLAALKLKYKGDKAALDFLTGHGIQDRLIDDQIARLEKALKGEHHAPGRKPAQRPAPATATASPSHHLDVRKNIDHGLRAIDRYKRHALKTGRKIDGGLGKIENALHTGMRVGRKVDHGLQRISGLAGQVAGFLGDDSPLGHLAGQVHDQAEAGHEKLHGAMKLAHTGSKQLHKGHALFHHLLDEAAGHHLRLHVARQPTHSVVHGPHGPMHHVIHVGPNGPEHHVVHHGPHGPEHHVVQPGPHGPRHHVVHHGPHGPQPHGPQHHGPHGPSHHGPQGPHHPGHRGPGLHLPHLKLPKVLQDMVDKARSLKDLPEWLQHELGLGGGAGRPHHPGRHHHHHHHVDREPAGPPSPGPAPHQPARAGMTGAEAADLVRRANLAVTGFGKGVTNAIRDITAMMHEGRTKDAGYRVQAVSVGSEQTRFECSRAVQHTAKYPALHKQAQQATRHYLEIRDSFFKFVHTLHGLAGEADADALDARKYPDLAALQKAIGSLEVKVNALGDVKSADTAMQAAVAPLKKDATALHGRLGAARARHLKDPVAESAIGAMWSRLGRLQRILGGHADKGNIQQGDKSLGVDPHHAPKQPHRRGHHHRPHHPRHRQHDPIDDVLDDHRIHVHRGGNRGDVDRHDGQEVDPAAMDTWLGAGHGVELFSQVFGAFLPAQGAPLQGHGFGHHPGGHGHGGGHHPGGGQHRGGGYHPGVDPILVTPIGPGQHQPHPAGPGGGQGSPHHPFDPLHRPDFHAPGHHPHHWRRGGGGILGRIGRMLPGRMKGFFHGMFEKLHGFADRIGGWAHRGSSLLGKGMHLAEEGMHGLSAIEGAAEKVQGFAGKAEGFLNKLHLGKAARFAHQIGGAAGFVDKEALLLHGGLKQADHWMGVGKHELGSVEKFSGRAGKAFARAEQGHLGAMLHLFKASRDGDGIDGKTGPEKFRADSRFDEPRRLDVGTMSRMEGFLGGDFSGVRLHTGPGAAQITGRYNAEAVTVKDHIFFAPGRYNTQSLEGQKLLAHELTHVLQRGRPNLDVRTAETEALGSERSYGSPQMETLNLGKPAPDFKLADGEGLGSSSGVHTAKRNRSRGHEAGGKDVPPDGDEFIERVSGRVYELLMEELEQSFESR